MELFYKARNIRDLDTVQTTTKAHWNELYINQNTYNEMIGSGSLYSIKNKTLKQSITAYYLQVEADRMYFRDVNKIQSHLWEVSPEIHPYKYLIDVPEYHEVDKASIDTT